jgi:hypothetical protein
MKAPGPTAWQRGLRCSTTNRPRDAAGLAKSRTGMPSLKNEGIDAPVGADIQAILARYQGLEVAKSTHRLAGENWLAGVTAKPMKLVLPNYADRRVVMPIVESSWSEIVVGRLRPSPKNRPV